MRQTLKQRTNPVWSTGQKKRKESKAKGRERANRRSEVGRARLRDEVRAQRPVTCTCTADEYNMQSLFQHVSFAPLPPRLILPRILMGPRFAASTRRWGSSRLCLMTLCT